ncbi:MAG TPA: GNAT family N-acetyltransferase [Propionibacteriaceae bacterium]|nr:GNAT family N-acetyltransferase [Propionibacteriaceae bacterium]
MHVHVLRPQELGPAEVERWGELQQQSLTLQNPFLSAEFAMVVGRSRPRARVAVVSDDAHQLAGFFAFEADRFGFAHPIGAGISDSQGFVHDANLDWSWSELLRAAKLRLCTFDHLIVDNLQSRQGWTVRTSPIVDLTGGYEKYIAEAHIRSKKTLKNLRYQERRLANDFDEVRFHFGTPDSRLVSRVLALKSVQYRNNGFPDLMGRADVMRIVDDLAHTDTPTLMPAFAALSVNGKLIAGDFSLRSKSVMAGWIAAHDVDYAKYSPGFVRTMRTIRACSEVGLAYLDMGKGDEEYKRPLTNGFLEVAEGAVLQRSVLARAYKASAAPKTHLYNYILSHQELRSVVRRSRRQIGRRRVALGAKIRGRDTE